MAPRQYIRTYYRFPLQYPVIFGGAPFVGEGVLTNLSLKGCSVKCDREVLCGSEVRVSILLNHHRRRSPSTLVRSNGCRAIGLGWSLSACPSKRNSVSIARYALNSSNG